MSMIQIVAIAGVVVLLALLLKMRHDRQKAGRADTPDGRTRRRGRRKKDQAPPPHEPMPLAAATSESAATATEMQPPPAPAEAPVDDPVPSAPGPPAAVAEDAPPFPPRPVADAPVAGDDDVVTEPGWPMPGDLDSPFDDGDLGAHDRMPAWAGAGEESEVGTEWPSTPDASGDGAWPPPPVEVPPLGATTPAGVEPVDDESEVAAFGTGDTPQFAQIDAAAPIPAAEFAVQEPAPTAAPPTFVPEAEARADDDRAPFASPGEGPPDFAPAEAFAAPPAPDGMPEAPPAFAPAEAFAAPPAPDAMPEAPPAFAPAEAFAAPPAPDGVPEAPPAFAPAEAFAAPPAPDGVPEAPPAFAPAEAFAAPPAPDGVPEAPPAFAPAEAFAAPLRPDAMPAAPPAEAPPFEMGPMHDGDAGPGGATSGPFAGAHPAAAGPAPEHDVAFPVTPAHHEAQPFEMPSVDVPQDAPAPAAFTTPVAPDPSPVAEGSPAAPASDAAPPAFQAPSQAPVAHPAPPMPVRPLAPAAGPGFADGRGGVPAPIASAGVSPSETANGVRAASEAAWWDDDEAPAPSIDESRTGRFALGGFAQTESQDSIGAVAFRHPLPAAPTAWVLGPAASPAGVLVLDVQGAINCDPASVEVLMDTGFAPSTEGFTIRARAAAPGPFMVSVALVALGPEPVLREPDRLPAARLGVQLPVDPGLFAARSRCARAHPG